MYVGRGRRAVYRMWTDNSRADEMIRPTALYVLMPRWFLDTDFNWMDFDIEAWSEDEYVWDQDPWSGLWDTVDEPERVLEEYGDCDDYSVVALSYLDSTTDHELHLVVLYSLRPLVGHVVAYDATTETVYSSGDIIDKHIDEYLADTTYSWKTHRKL